jgi:predicted transcriptional regulator
VIRVSAKRSLRERKFIKAYVENGGNATEAYLAVNPKVKRDSARVLGARLLAKVNVSVSELLDGLGVTDTYLGKILKEGLEASKVVSVVPIPPKPGKEGSPDLPEAGSKNVEFIDIPDYNVRVKYLDMAYKLKGKYKEEEKEGEGLKLEPLRVIIRSDGKDKKRED